MPDVFCEAAALVVEASRERCIASRRSASQTAELVALSWETIALSMARLVRLDKAPHASER